MKLPSKDFSVRRLVDPGDAEPVNILIAEHRVAEQALNCLERMAEQWSEPGRHKEMDCQAVEEAIIFFRVFVETWHFRREEAYFGLTGVCLENVEIGESGTCTFHDHERCSLHLSGIEEAVRAIRSRWEAGSLVRSDDAPTASGALDLKTSLPVEVAAAYRRFGEHARAYSDILLRHIEDEEDFIYPTIQRRTTPESRQAAEEAFRRVSHSAVDWRKLDDCLAIVDRLAERFGIALQTSSIRIMNEKACGPGEY